MTTPLRKTVERYLQLCAQTLRPGSVDGKRADLYSLTSFLRQHHRAVRSWNLVRRHPHIEGWLNHLHDAPLKPATRRARINALRRFFDDMLDWQWPEAPPSNLILPTDLPAKEYYLPRPLPQDLDHALIDALKRTPSLRTMGLLLLRYTGMRLGELIDLDLNALDGRDHDNFTLRVPLGKTRREHVIPVSAETAALLKAIQTQRATQTQWRRPLPPSIARYLMVDHLGKRPSSASYGVILKKAALSISCTERIHPHRLRHTFATEMIRGGMSVQVLMKILGHTTAATTMRYVEIANADLRRAYDSAIKQLGVLKNLKMTEPVSRCAQPAHLHDIIEILITTLETYHRDNQQTPMAAPLARFVKRLRRTRDDLSRLLQIDPQ